MPDVYVTRIDDEWRVTLNPENEPGLKLNNYYIDLLRKSGGKDADYLRGRLQEARWLMSSLELRNQTLIRVSQSIVEFQQDFLEQGEMAMKPLVLKEISEAIGVHESTVSRATTRKYMLTPRGLFELKYFFSSHVRTDRGGTISATAVKARLQVLLEKEPTGKPPERSGPVRIATADRDSGGQEDRGQIPRVTGNRIIKRTPAALPAHTRMVLNDGLIDPRQRID